MPGGQKFNNMSHNYCQQKGNWKGITECIPQFCQFVLTGIKIGVWGPSQQQPRQTIDDQGKLYQTKAAHGRPKHCDIRGATSISDAFFADLALGNNSRIPFPVLSLLQYVSSGRL